MTKEMKELKIIVKINLDSFWIEKFEAKDLTYKEIDSLRKKVTKQLKEGLKEKEITLQIQTELVWE